MNDDYSSSRTVEESERWILCKEERERDGDNKKKKRAEKEREIMIQR